MLSSSSSCSVHVICYFRLKTTSFDFFTPIFFLFQVFKKKIRVTAIIMLCMDDTFHEDDVLMIFDALEEITFVNLFLVKTTFPRHFVVEERPTTSFSPALPVTNSYACVL